MLMGVMKTAQGVCIFHSLFLCRLPGFAGRRLLLSGIRLARHS
jgi:hypothetical protein